MDDYARGPASSLNKTISSLRRFVGGGRRTSGAQGWLRGVLDGLIWEVGRKGLEAGYRAAHEQIARHVEEDEIFPTVISFEGNPRLAPGVDVRFATRSSIQKVKIFKIPAFLREISFWDRFR